MSRPVQLIIWIAIGVVLAIAAVLLWSERTERAIVVQPLALDATIVVDIRGGVATPGTVHLSAGGRVADAVAAAGGLTGDADVSRLNMASRLADGQRLVIPTGGVALASGPIVTATADAPAPVRGSPATAPAPTVTARLNLNTASAKELEALPGIGEVLAGRIVAYREANGPFRSIDQLGEVRGVSPKTLDKLRPLVTVDG